ncbi:bifunctional precorrin-2 dehydrogenase/sirohydrochlorin ferrochelatase [Nitrosopumilus sp.]|jgi:precorrin-2 dehydrogenase/sirohydrochlorin ferrochelatase|nr:bifunctional precorrin-2 dehydrogenase/sirohydrochlorin ferrochelatase [Nitrosopumilus sp.]
MIINLNLEGKKIIIVGGGNEAEKRIKSIVNEKCEIMVISDSVNAQISKLVKTKKITLKKQKIKNIKFILESKPDLIITTTNDKKINQKIINYAKKNKIIAYSSDNPEDSDFANAAIIDFQKMIQVAIFTGGRSPIMAKKIKSKAEIALKKVISKEDISQIKIQKISRELSKEIIPTQFERKECLRSIMTDSHIDQLIKDGQIKKAEKRAIEILKKWK